MGLTVDRVGVVGKDVAKWLRERREELGLSRQQVATRAGQGVSASHLAKLETGDRRLTADVAQAIAPALRVEVAWLLQLAGFLPDDTKVNQPEQPKPVAFRDALKGDPNLTKGEKRAMQQLYDTFLREKKGRE
jgi:transcriptional regulator with XRE-family HTH domain